jgi:hypothetical protein
MLQEMHNRFLPFQKAAETLVLLEPAVCVEQLKHQHTALASAADIGPGAHSPGNKRRYNSTEVTRYNSILPHSSATALIKTRFVERCH